MRKYCGDAVVHGIVAGQIYLIKKKNEYRDQVPADNLEAEWLRVHHAMARTMRQIEVLTEQARIYAGESAAGIFEAHQMILMDDEFCDSIHNTLLEERVSGEMAVSKTGEKFADMLLAMDMDYMRARAADIRDITERILQNMNEEEETQIQQMKNAGPVILVAESLNPSDIFRFGKDSIAGLVTTRGSITSHAAILARTMNIPSIIHVTNLPLNELTNGSTMIVDSQRGRIILDPTEEQLIDVKERRKKLEEEQEALKVFLGVKSITKSGHEVNVLANISEIDESNNVNQYQGDGIGLFRSEFLYMGRKDFPTEEEQFQRYKDLLLRMQGKMVIVRTADIGSDKPLDYFEMEEEVNPSLGLRGIRFSLKYPELFKVQLRALFRAAVYGNLHIMYPLITSTVELENIQKIVEEAVLELETAHLAYKIPPQGIMIETPAAVMIADELAEMADFFSIGTSDLAQYALAIDRANTDLNMMHNPQHEGIIRMIDMTIQAAHRHNIWAGICGEMAADETLLKRFVAMGVDEVSVAAHDILKVRKIISEL